MNKTTVTHVVTAGMSGGFVLALITLITKGLGHYNISLDAETSAALMAILTPLVHIACMKLGLDPSDKPVAPGA